MNRIPIIRTKISANCDIKYIDLIESDNSNGDEYYLRCVIGYYWKSFIDDEGNECLRPRDVLSEPMDKDQRWQQPIEGLFVRNILERLRNNPINENADNSACGCDGKSFSIQFRNFYNERVFDWWMWTPDGWETLGDIIDLLDSRVRIRGTYWI